MPHFTLQLGPGGPLLTAVAMVSEPRRVALQGLNQPIPQPQRIRALVDTGASCTNIDPSVVTALGLVPTGTAQVLTPTTGNVPVTTDQYDIGLAIYAATVQAPLMLPTVPVITAELLQPQGFHALIGRDILSQCVLVYNGSSGFFTLAF
jgi:hypothetical protein